MKTKVYKLAAELGVREDRVLEWLRNQGYPHMRRADMVRSDLVVAARETFRETGAASNDRTAYRPSEARSRSHEQSSVKRPSHQSTQNAVGKTTPNLLTSSFAELFGEQLNLDTNRATGPALITNAEPAQKAPPDQSIIDARLKMERERFENDVKVLRAELAAAVEEASLLRREVEQGRQVVVENAVMKERLARAQEELEELNARFSEVNDERTTLDGTCASLLERIRELESVRGDFESLEEDHSSIMSDLEATQARETAWRARALELEKASQSGGLESFLSQLGADTPRARRQVLTALVSAPSLEKDLRKVFSRVDPNALRTLVEQHCSRVCTHPVCQRCVHRRQKVPIIVDNAKNCSVCQASTMRRRVAAMVAEATHSGMRRMLIFGATQKLSDRFRSIAEGSGLDFRFVSDEEDTSANKATGRVESCDCLVLWTHHVLEPNHYLEAARARGRLWVVVNGSPDSVEDMCRQVTQRLARQSNLLTR